MKTKLFTTGLALVMGLGLVVMASLTLFFLVGPVYPVRAAACSVETGGSGDYTTIQAAINNPLCTTINVVTGVYTENLTITRSLTLLGGCDDITCTTRTPRTSIINGNNAGVVISITNGAAPTIDGFTITHGDGSTNIYPNSSGTLDAGGGGIFIRNATAVISNNLIINNVGSVITNAGAVGGGILVLTSTNPVFIYSNTIQANVAHSVTLATSEPISGAAGGGIIIGDASTAIISRNLILSNTALRANLPPQNTWSGGGGVGWWGDQITLDGNTIQGNTGNEAGSDGSGGGIALWGKVATVTNNSIMYNTAAMSGNGSGGGLGVWCTVATVTNNSIMYNTAAISGTYADGGGLTAGSVQTLTLTGNWVMTNTAMLTAASTALPQNTWVGGGGANIDGGGALNDKVTVQNNHFIGNVAVRAMAVSGNGAKGHAEGGGLIARNITTTIVTGNEVRGNVAVENLSTSGGSPYTDTWGGRPSGGGLFLDTDDALTLSNNTIANNIGVRQHVVNEADSNSEGGGVALTNIGSGTVSNNTVSGNTAVVSGSLTSDRGRNYGPGGGGIKVGCYDRPNCTLSFAGNHILSNTTAYTLTIDGDDARSGGRGGGLDADSDTSRGAMATLSFNSDEVSYNRALVWSVGSSGDNQIDASGGGMNIGNARQVVISNCTVARNLAGTIAAYGNGGGININSVQTITVQGSWVMTNTAVLTATSTASTQDTSAEGGGLRIDKNDVFNGKLTLQNNHFIGNVAARDMTVSGNGARGHAQGGGLMARGITTTVMTDNEVRGNVAVENLSMSGGEPYTDTWGGRPSGGGMRLEDQGNLTLNNNTVANNITVRQHVISETDSNSEGGGIALSNIGSGTVSANTVSGNTATFSASLTSDRGRNYGPGGGGVRIDCGNDSNCALTFSSNQIVDNITVQTITLSGNNVNSESRGGGIDGQERTSLSFNNNTVSRNRALVFGTGSGSYRIGSRGGGLSFDRANLVTIGGSSCTIEDNIATQSANYGLGGGVSMFNTPLNMSGCTVRRNWALVRSETNNGNGDGGGIVVDTTNDLPNLTAILTNNRIESNVALGYGVASGGNGGGIRIMSIVTATMTGNSILSNTGAISTSAGSGQNCGGGGGGVFIDGNDTVQPTVLISNNVIAGNTAAMTVTASGGGNGGGNGGGIALNRMTAATIISNQIRSNQALQSGVGDGNNTNVNANGGGFNLSQMPTTTIRLNRIENNVGAGSIILTNNAGGGAADGGIFFDQSTALAQANVISGGTGNLNGNGWGGGVNLNNQSQVTMDSNFILGNRTTPTPGGGNSGVWVWNSVLTSTNDVFVRNYDGVGGGNDFAPSRITLINDTFYNNGYTGVSINDNSTLYVTNTIVYSHDNGLSLNSGSATLIENYNLLSNTTNYNGSFTTGSNDITGQNPLFKNAAGDDFHLTSQSPAIDKGTSSGAPKVDFEGDTRPQGSKIDIGADELKSSGVYLPIILKNK